MGIAGSFVGRPIAGTPQASHRHAGGYLPEVDGLRAVAVLSVLIFHLNPAWLPGGFTGVDVFFVISGYVVAKSLAERPTGSFRAYLLDFYARRIVRLLPALVLCLLTTSLLTVLFVPASWLSHATKGTALAAFFGVSNVALLTVNDGYFSPILEYNPFVHTWSLGVEEQFYLVFPALLFLWIAWRGQEGIQGLAAGALLPVLGLASLVAAAWLGEVRGEWAFYLLPARLWELGAGALLYQWHAASRALPGGSIAASIGLAGGLGLIAAGFWLAQPAHFPWPWALLPVIGTVAAIAAVARPELNRSVLHRTLGHPIAVDAGRLSYALYLWHWPVFALFRWTVGLDRPVLQSLAIGATVLLSAASYHLVEQAVRSSPAVRSRRSWVTVTAGVALTAGAAVLAGQMFDNRKTLSLSVTRDVVAWYPYAPKAAGPLPAERPLAGRRLFLIGNSHAAAYEAMVVEAQRRLGVEVAALPTGRCAIANLLVPIREGGACAETEAAMMDLLERSARPGDLVFFASLRMHRFVDQWSRFDIGAVAARSRGPEGEAERLEALDEAAAVIERLQGMGLTVLIDAPKPVFPAPAFRCSDWFNRANPVCAGGLTVERAFLEDLRAPVMRSLTALESRFGNVLTWDPFPTLCPEETCAPYDREGKPTFFDGDHLSGHGNRVLYPAFEQVLLDLWRARPAG